MLGADEPRAAEPSRVAWELAHGGGADPGLYPSLLVYVLAPFQAWQAEPSARAAQLVVVALGVAGVAAAWWLGERAYGTVAAGVAAATAAVATVHVAYSRVEAPDVLMATLVTVALALLAAGRIEFAGAAVGLAAAAKYPGALALVPLVVVGWSRWRRLAVAAGLGVAAFAVASPYAFVHPGAALSQLRDDAAEARSGTDERFALVAYADHLWETLGPALLVAAAGLVAALAGRARADRALAAFALVYLVALLPFGSHEARYVLPLVPVLGVLAGRFRSIAAVTLLLLVVPLTWSVRETRDATAGQPSGVVLSLRSGP